MRKITPGEMNKGLDRVILDTAAEVKRSADLNEMNEEDLGLRVENMRDEIEELAKRTVDAIENGPVRQRGEIKRPELGAYEREAELLKGHIGTMLEDLKLYSRILDEIKNRP